VKKLLSTLFVTTEGTNLRKGGENIVAKVEGAERAPVRHHMLGSVMVFGAIFISPPLSQALAGGGITLVLLDRAGRFQAPVEGQVSGNVLLRRSRFVPPRRPTRSCAVSSRPRSPTSALSCNVRSATTVKARGRANARA
jgi:CRISP-associated protein Cas1